MTSRARLMLDALEDGCETREQIFRHQRRFSLLNNASSELRAAGIEVVCEVEDGEYHYRLLNDGHVSHPGDAVPSPDTTDAPVVEQPDGQLVIA